MKKIIIALLIACMLIGALSACGQEPKAADTVTSSTAQTEENNEKSEAPKAEASTGEGSSGSIYVTPGDELTDYLKALTWLEEEYIKTIDESGLSDMDALGAQMSISIPGLAFLALPMYDVLSVEDLPKEEGKLMLSGMDAVREKKGNEIRFSAGMTYTEENGINKKGDKYSEIGILDTKTNFLSGETKIENGGKISSRAAYEAVVLKDGTCIIQYFSVGSSGVDSNAKPFAVFKRYNKDGYTAIVTDFESETNFTYDSIAGKGDIQPEEMAKKYKVTAKFTVKDGKVEFTK